MVIISGFINLKKLRRLNTAVFSCSRNSSNSLHSKPMPVCISTYGSVKNISGTPQLPFRKLNIALYRKDHKYNLCANSRDRKRAYNGSLIKLQIGEHTFGFLFTAVFGVSHNYECSQLLYLQNK